MPLLRAASSPELVLDFCVPASVASRYRARLVTVSPVEAQIRFPFCPAVFREIGSSTCLARISLVFERSVVQVRGLCRLEAGGGTTAGRIRFTEPVALHDYALLRRACGLESSVIAESGLDRQPQIVVLSEPELTPQTA